ncbi:MAG: acyl-[acyl-carrier-protein]--UDP-N-acetylglucosamine O-acyltransferase [Candidatus Omnitrophica bacterium CG11_big_fil_rev_8_21_14_0_20_63_9]|nr:MAG: acyl-[acyl-carrier-protein]--UDP-N-acetylglucosamine O-acyltransferase [Candidatus Omnitrophica bacterium CG11_big_fil_rev_8_21_14_0_20_63_9]
MTNVIHSSAVVGKHVTLGEGNSIGPGCVIEDGAALGSRNKLWMNVYVGPGTTIGDENQLHMGAVIGHTPQDLAYTGAASYTKIGHRNTIREYVTIHRGTKEGTSTVIGDENFFMANVHIAHNCEIGNKVILVNVASLTGYCVVEDGAFLSGIVGLHQFTRIGRLAMISALSAVNKDVPPYMLCGGRPAVIQGLNVVGMRRAGIAAPVREEIKKAYKFLYRDGLNVPHAIEAIERECKSPEVKHLVEFVKASKRGICAGIGADAESEGEGEESLLPKKPRQDTKRG